MINPNYRHINSAIEHFFEGFPQLIWINRKIITRAVSHSFMFCFVISVQVSVIVSAFQYTQALAWSV